MKKEDLIKLGLDETLADKVAVASTEELKGYVPRERLKEATDAKKAAEDALKERDTQLETLKTSTGDTDALRKQIETLQADNKAKDETHQAEIKALQVNNAVAAALAEAKARNPKAVQALLNLEKAELDADGKVKGLTEQLTKLKEAEDSKFLFDTGTKFNLKGAKVGETGNEDGDHKVDISKMSYEELATYMEENPDAQI